MKLTGSVAVGLIVALVVLYWIRPVSNATIAVVIVICCGLSAGVATLLTRGSGETK